MREYGAEIRGTSATGEQLVFEVYYWPMNYGDWSSFSVMKKQYEPAVIRYLFTRYISRSYRITAGVISQRTECGIDDLLQLPSGKVVELIDLILKGSEFGSTEEFIDIIDSYSKQLHGLQGCYEYFIFLHGGYELYRASRDMNAHERASLIALIQEQRGINVRRRFDVCISQDLDLDLVTPDEKWDRNVRKNAGRDKSRQLMNQKQPAQNPMAKLDPTTASMIESARQGLDEALAQGKRNKSVKGRYYNWNRENAEFDGAGTRE